MAAATVKQIHAVLPITNFQIIKDSPCNGSEGKDEQLSVTALIDFRGCNPFPHITRARVNAIWVVKIMGQIRFPIGWRCAIPCCNPHLYWLGCAPWMWGLTLIRHV